MTVLVTGVAGFIGFHTAQALLAQGRRVIGIDIVNDYYDPRLKQARLALLLAPGFSFHRLDVADQEGIFALIEAEPGITHIVHLAAQAGVRYSMVNPRAYVHSNVMGHVVMLEAALRLQHLRHFVYASSSSVYGLNRDMPFIETARVETPASLYAATKLADELISHAYAHLHGLVQTGLRFFTVYGPWGRPDMAYYSFAHDIVRGRPITLYDGGALKRDFTYIDDIVSGIVAVMDRPPDSGSRVLNIGNNRSEKVSRLVALLEQALGHRAIIQSKPRPASDVVETWANVDAIAEIAGFRPSTPLEVGVPRFAAWFQEEGLFFF